jgi:hypothetical protein
MITWDKVENAVANCKGIAFDTCHKIYVLMDDEQVALMRKYEYEEIRTAEEMSPSEMLDTLRDWFEDSCGLRFIQGVTTNHEDPNLGFEDLIGQFDDVEDEPEDEEEEDDYEEEEDD